MRLLLITLLLACMAPLAACTTTPAAPAADSVTFIVVRHAEKAADDPRDPNLSEAGRMRASRLATLLEDRDVVAVYATDFRRTRQTAGPTAKSHGVTITPYDAVQPAATFAERLRRENPMGTALVVGHSNTVPDIVAALCRCSVAPIDDSDYGNFYEVRIASGVAPMLSRRHY